MWALAIEHAIGRWLNAFIVTDHKDSLLLRGCAKEANYGNLQIIIYDFTRPKYVVVPFTRQHFARCIFFLSPQSVVLSLYFDFIFAG